MAVTLIDCRIRSQAVNVAFAFDIPYVDALAPFQHYRYRMVAVVLIIEYDEYIKLNIIFCVIVCFHA